MSHVQQYGRRGVRIRRRGASLAETLYIPRVQKVISDMKSRLKDPDLARLFENTFPNTLGAYSSMERVSWSIYR